MNRDWIEKTEAFLKESFEAAAHLKAAPEQKAYRIAHSYRVANIGREIAKAEGFDETEMVVACLLHDVAYSVDFGEQDYRDHGRVSAKLARPFLQSLGMAKDRIDDVCYGIAIHVDDEADFAGVRTPFALSVGDADNIDRFDAYRIHAWLCRDGFIDMTEEEQRAYVKKRLSRLTELMDVPMGTETAARLWKERLTFNRTFFEKLADQMANSTSIPD